MHNVLRQIFLAVALMVSVAAGAADLALPPATAPMLTPATTPYFIRLGVAAAISDTDIRVRLAGAPVAGGNGSIGAVPVAYAEAGYYLTRAVAVSFAFGYPPTLTTKGTGTLAPFGTLYRAEVGFPVLAVTYHLDAFGPFRPYAGLGVGYAIVFRNIAAAVTSPRLHDSAAFVLVGGFDYDLTAHWGVFVDVKKAFLSQRFAGIAAPFPGGPQVLPVTASVRSDPLVVTSGFSYRF